MSQYFITLSDERHARLESALVSYDSSSRSYNNKYGRQYNPEGLNSSQCSEDISSSFLYIFSWSFISRLHEARSSNQVIVLVRSSINIVRFDCHPEMSSRSDQDYSKYKCNDINKDEERLRSKSLGSTES